MLIKNLKFYCYYSTKFITQQTTKQPNEFLTNCAIQQVIAQLVALMPLIIELDFVKLIHPMLCNAQVFDGVMWRVVSELVVRQHCFDLRSIVEVVEAFDGDEFGVLKQGSFKTNFKVLSIGSESSKWVVLG